MKIYFLAYKILLLIFIIGFAGCSARVDKFTVIKIKGSDTMLHLTELLAQKYMMENPKVSIYVEGGGTATGIKALSGGETDICTASRPVKADEVKTLSDNFGLLGISTVIGKDALSIYINKNNPVKNFTVDQLKEIFTGKLTNWKQLNGPDMRILPILRTPNSGTYYYFKEHILNGEEYAYYAYTRVTTEEVIESVEDNINAIGYGGIGYKGETVHAKINGIEPTEENVRNDSYPIIRYLHFYTTGVPQGAVKKFIDWVISPEGQKLVSESGYIPIWQRPF